MSVLIKWNYETCKSEALKFPNIIEFRKQRKWAYKVCKDNGWLLEFYNFKFEGKPSNYWSKENCKEVALECNNRTEFKQKYGGAYIKSHRNGWLNEICFHMEQIDKPKNYWTKEKCAEIAKLYNTKTQFKINETGAFDASYKNGWLDEICFHMKPVGNLYKRLVYSVEFSDKSVYIGLTCNPARRKNEHIKGYDSINTAAFDYKVKTGIEPIFTELTKYLNVEDAIKMEEYYVNHYRLLGYNILNKNKTGAIGWSPKNLGKAIPK